MPLLVLCEGLAHPGAVANVAWQQALRLSRDQPVCLISDGLSPERRQQLQQAPQLRVRLLRVPGFTALHRFGHLSRQLVWIVRALQALSHELPPGESATLLCHSHPLAIAVALRFRQRVRLLLISHGDPFLRPPGSYDPAILWLYRRCAGPAHRRAAVSVALSPAMVRRIEAHGVDERHIALIPNGLDPAEIGLDAPPLTPVSHWRQVPLRLLFVGRLDAVKGVDVLLEAVSLADRQGIPLQLELIAPATERQARDLQQVLRSRGLSPRVRLLGPRPRRSLAAHYLACHLVVVPSRDDPLPTVVLEALACGRPILASDVGGIAFQLQQGACGVLVPPGKPEALALEIIRLERDRLALAGLAERALQRSHQFSWDDNVKALRASIAPLRA